MEYVVAQNFGILPLPMIKFVERYASCCFELINILPQIFIYLLYDAYYFYYFLICNTASEQNSANAHPENNTGCKFHFFARCYSMRDMFMQIL